MNKDSEKQKGFYKVLQILNGKTKTKDLTHHNTVIKKTLSGWVYSSMVECLPSMDEALDLIPCTKNKQTKKMKQQQQLKKTPLPLRVRRLRRNYVEIRIGKVIIFAI
jgi:hypothetical protein